MTEVTYIKLFVDYLDAIEPLGDAERGRLFTSLLEYARTGAAPQLSGNERFLFPMMRAQIDRDIAALEEMSSIRSESGKKGGRPKKQEESKKAIGFSESKKSKDKDNDNDKDKIKEKVEKKTGKADASRRSTTFQKPSPEEVEAYCKERGNNVDARRFYDFYESKGWLVGKNKMKDWKAAVRTWECREKATGSADKGFGDGETSYDIDALDRYWDNVPTLD